jgi:hypothetical protein
MDEPGLRSLVPEMVGEVFSSSSSSETNPSSSSDLIVSLVFFLAHTARTIRQANRQDHRPLLDVCFTAEIEIRLIPSKCGTESERDTDFQKDGGFLQARICLWSIYTSSGTCTTIRIPS